MEKTYKYTCELCNYKTNNKKDYTKHTMTRKHKRKINALKQKPQPTTSLQIKNQKENNHKNQPEIKEKKTRINYVSPSF